MSNSVLTVSPPPHSNACIRDGPEERTQLTGRVQKADLAEFTAEPAAGQTGCDAAELPGES